MSANDLPEWWMESARLTEEAWTDEEPDVPEDVEASEGDGLTLVNDDTPDFDRHYLGMLERVAWDTETSDRALFAESAIPDMVQERIRETIMAGSVFSDFKTIPSSEVMQLREYLTESLEQDGWTTDGLADQLMDLEGIEERYEAERIARTETQHIVQESRESAYEERGLAEEQFKWLGTEDNRTTEACTWLKEQTNPKFGGTPRTLDELKELVTEANERFVDHDAREWTPHIQCRHTYVRHVD